MRSYRFLLICGAAACLLGAPSATRAASAEEAAREKKSKAIDTTRVGAAQLDTSQLDPDEKRVLALLGMIGSEKPEQVARARSLLGREDDAHKLVPMLVALRCEPASLRRFAAGELARLADPKAVRPLLERTVRDRDAQVRAAAADALEAIRSPSAVHALGRALVSRSSTTRVRAAEALGRIADVRACAYLVWRWEARSGASPRAYFAQTSQFSYIGDFDVEVA